MKTQIQIEAEVQRLIDPTRPSELPWRAETLTEFLPFEKVRGFLPENAEPADWVHLTLDRGTVVKEMENYMTFAWGKVHTHMGLPASRSIERMLGWLWILEDFELVAFAEDPKNFPQYGAPILRKICERYGFQIPEIAEIDRMSQGEPCTTPCYHGCAT